MRVRARVRLVIRVRDKVKVRIKVRIRVARTVMVSATVTVLRLWLRFYGLQLRLQFGHNLRGSSIFQARP